MDLFHYCSHGSKKRGGRGMRRRRRGRRKKKKKEEKRKMEEEEEEEALLWKGVGRTLKATSWSDIQFKHEGFFFPSFLFFFEAKSCYAV
jgi:hypothetical protein